MIPPGPLKRALVPAPSVVPLDRGEAGDGRDHSGGGDFSNGVVAGIGDVEVALGINDQALRIAEAGVVVVSISVAGVFGHSGQGADGAVGGDFADGVVVAFGDIDVACGVGGDAGGGVETGAASGAVGAAGCAGLAGKVTTRLAR